MADKLRTRSLLPTLAGGHRCWEPVRLGCSYGATRVRNFVFLDIVNSTAHTSQAGYSQNGMGLTDQHLAIVRDQLNKAGRQ